MLLPASFPDQHQPQFYATYLCWQLLLDWMWRPSAPFIPRLIPLFTSRIKSQGNQYQLTAPPTVSWVALASSVEWAARVPAFLPVVMLPPLNVRIPTLISGVTVSGLGSNLRYSDSCGEET